MSVYEAFYPLIILFYVIIFIVFKTKQIPSLRNVFQPVFIFNIFDLFLSPFRGRESKKQAFVDCVDYGE